MNTNIINKVRKLLATAADTGATPAEAQTALSIAQRLMAQHRVTERDIAQFAKNEARAAGHVGADDMVAEGIGPWSIRQDGWIAMACADACGCGVYRSVSIRYTPKKRGAPGYDRRRVSEMLAYGLPTDVAVCRELYTWARERMRADRKGYCAASAVKQNSVAGRSFADGWAHELLKRARSDKAARLKSEETIEVVRAHSGTRALLVLGEAEVRHERALAVKGKQLGLGKTRGVRARRDSAAYGLGRATGSQVSLSREVLR